MSLRRLSGASARLLLIGLAAYGLLLVWGRLQSVLLPFVIALLLTTVLDPVVGTLHARLRVPRGLGALLAVVALIVVVLGLVVVVAPDIVGQAQEIETQVEQGVQRLPDVLRDLGLRDADIEELSRSVLERLQQSVGEISSQLSRGALTAAQGVASLASGTFLTAVMLIYLLSSGKGFWRGMLRFVPAERRASWDAGGRRAWAATTQFVRSQVLVAAIDGVGIGLGLWLIGVPLALPLGVLTFVLAFLPYIGAILAGVAAALVALSTLGIDAMLGAIAISLIVQQLEGNVLYPLLIGRSVHLHPLTVLLGVGAGGALLGVVGWFLATPVIAAVAAGAGWIAGDEELVTADREACGTDRGS